MTDNEIIKGLGCCAKSSWLDDCDGCPCFDPKEDIQTSECQERLMKYASDLINRQKEEIERLKENIDGLNIFTTNHIKVVRLQAIKEFAKRLKERIYKGGVHPSVEDEFICDIDNLEKEMVGEDNA